MFVRAVGGSFHGPAMTSSTSLMVPKEHLTRIQGVNQKGIVAIDVVTALFAIVPLFFIPIPQPEREPEEGSIPTSFFQDLVEGFRYVLSWRGLLAILIMATMINFLLSPATSLLPLLVKEHFQGDALQLGWMDSIFGIGVITGGIALGVWGGFKRRIRTTMMGLIGIGVGTLLLGLIPGTAFSFALLAMAITGIMMPIANGSIGGIMQATVDPGMQGRVFSLTGSAATAMIPIGLALAGVLSDAFDIQIWFQLGGIVTLLMGFVGLAIPAVMTIEDGPAGRSDQEN